MPDETTPMEWNADAQAEAYRTTQEIYDALNDAYWHANSIRDKDRIKGISDEVFKLLTQLNRQSIQARTAEYNQLRDEFRANEPRFALLRDEIDEIIQSVAVAARVAGAIDRGIRLASRFAA